MSFQISDSEDIHWVFDFMKNNPKIFGIVIKVLIFTSTKNNRYEESRYIFIVMFLTLYFISLIRIYKRGYETVRKNVGRINR